jgi:aromatic-L-amino-acid decarboxylase
MPRLELTADQYRALARELADFTADYLQDLPELPAFPRDVNAEETERLFHTELPKRGVGKAAFAEMADMLRLSRPNSPRFFGYVFGSGLPVGALGDFAAAVMNQNVTAWRSGPAATTIERTVVSWLAQAVGCEGFQGSLTGGGSAANLMGLCMAREAKAPANGAGNANGIIYCSAEAHMSIPKAAMLLGMGQRQVRRISVDSSFRVEVSQLRKAIARDRAEGGKPVAVVATAGTVSTGSIDDLEAIADLCAEESLWLHVDGAYGALASLAAPEKFKGLNRADSLSLDPHKWLYQPAGCGCLLFRDPTDARRAFSHSEDYARSLSTDPIEGFAFFEESMELSRPFRALKVWLSLRYYGLTAFREAIGEDLRLAKVLAEAIEAEPTLELLAPVELSAVCFRYRNAKGDLDDLNRRILQEVIRRGRVYISNATVHGRFALRACVVNHRSEERDVLSILSEVLSVAAELLPGA